jgi:hypothetical protein
LNDSNYYAITAVGGWNLEDPHEFVLLSFYSLKGLDRLDGYPLFVALTNPGTSLVLVDTEQIMLSARVEGQLHVLELFIVEIHSSIFCLKII